MRIKNIFLILSFIFFISQNCPAQDFKNVSAIIHVQSKVSDGKYSIEEIVNLAEEDGIKVVIITDSLLRRWEYGLGPLSNIFKRVLEESSIIKFGIKKYLKQISDAQESHPDIIVIGAAEVAPFYFWSGNYLSHNLTLNSWHKKFVVLGLKEEQDYRDMPVVASYYIFPRNLKHVLNFWPILIVGLGFLLAKMKIKKQLSFSGKIFLDFIQPFRKLGIFLIVVGAVFLLAALRFPVSSYDIYYGEQGIKPYQSLIDYVNQKNGLTFWTHPEANYARSFLGAMVSTPGYKDDLLKSVDYSGFAGIYHDNSTATNPADLWDRLLNYYCSGRRKKPVWIFGEAAWDGNMGVSISSIETILLLKDFNQKGVVNALREGKMYAKLNYQKNNFSLDKFCITDEKRNSAGFMGDDVKISGTPQVLIKAGFQNPTTEETDIKLIQNGEIIEEFKAKSRKIAIIFKDKKILPNKKSFYRLQIENKDCLILTNPIFVTSEG